MGIPDKLIIICTPNFGIMYFGDSTAQFKNISEDLYAAMHCEKQRDKM